MYQHPWSETQSLSQNNPSSRNPVALCWLALIQDVPRPSNYQRTYLNSCGRGLSVLLWFVCWLRGASVLSEKRVEASL